MFGEIFRRRVADHPERLGCPVAAAALARPEDPALAAVATAAFQSWERPIAAALREEGVSRAEAEAFAGLVVSTVEGALLRARAAGDHAPLDSAVAGLGPGARRPAARSRAPGLSRPHVGQTQRSALRRKSRRFERRGATVARCYPAGVGSPPARPVSLYSEEHALLTSAERL